MAKGRSSLKPVTQARRWNRRKGGGVTRATAPRVLAQGACAVPKKAFGAGKNPNGWKKAMTLGLNARLPYHLGLPRPVGPYQVIRTTKVHTTKSGCVIFTPLQRRHDSLPGEPRWYAACGMEAVNTGVSINAANNATMISMPMDVLGSACDVVPAAMSVQVMCPTALQNASGAFTMARVNQQLTFGGDTRPWGQFITQFNSFFRPRLLTGGKLALRGVHANAYPLDMSEYAHFAGVVPSLGTTTWNAITQSATRLPAV
ncbi:hypothetical protein [Beihai weivirus-like virus 5]|uniref:hypothetical protein n=1 Tax=Beihai weivirus-like virus 5 TaxID=1922753 RepID=UPI0009098958|nr:hypothetical protein [Beihai weivirus-like virus 5]APG78098.1 hypothetical protein [Beihai weivirus-like virus 5]